MNRYLNNKGELPPNAWPEQKQSGFAFKNLETGILMVAPSWKELIAKVQRFNIQNHFPIGSEFEQQIENQLCERLPPNWCSDLNPNRTAEVPRQEWPTWAKLLALVGTDSDKGIGDVIARTIGPFGGEAYKKWYELLFQKPCGCAERQDNYNALYPLNLEV